MAQMEACGSSGLLRRLTSSLRVFGGEVEMKLELLFELAIPAAPPKRSEQPMNPRT
jgi:hypothetical protein